MKSKEFVCYIIVGMAMLMFGGRYAACAPDPNPPASPVKLIFIHHSCGENWLSDSDGGLGLALRNNNYFVSDTNYGWGPDGIGDRTDIGNWWDWFLGSNSSTCLSALYNESDQNSSYSRLATDPGGENEVIMFKSCFPNSGLGGNASDPPASGSNPLRGQDVSSSYHTVGNAKGIYNDILEYFATQQDKLFILITSPPQPANDVEAEKPASNARALNNWLVNDWLDSYPYNNVAVFDFYNILTSNGGSSDINDIGQTDGNHHLYRDGAIEHIQTVNQDTAAYATDIDDGHPTSAGNQKATAEFIDLLNIYYNSWEGAGSSPGVELPTVTTNSATSVTSTSATLNGTVNPNGLSATYYFQYGTSDSYGLNSTEANAGSGTSDFSVNADISGLVANTTYHFRIVATNSAGTTYGSDRTFTTSGTETGNMITSDLWIRAVINTVEKGAVDAVWQKGGEDTTSRGDRVIWGHFYASPDDVTWGSSNNPDLFVKIWFDVGGRVDVNFFHVSVPEIEVYSDYPYDGTPDEQGTTTMSRRYIRQYYEGGQSYSDENYEDGNPPSGYAPAGDPSGYSIINDLRIGSIINTVEKGPIDAVWRLGGQDTTSRGDQVVWGHFYANPNDVTWGSQNNPDLFVKIWFDVGGRVDVNFFHVSVPDIEVYSDLPDDGAYNSQGTTIMNNRYIRHEFSWSGSAPPVDSYVIEVGPGREHEDLSTVDWPSLKAGDDVRIYWRQEPYRSKIGLRSRGTADQPIRITGIANANGARPVISGINATTPISLNGFFEEEWTEGLGVIVIHRGDDDEWGYKPGYIQIEGLKIEGGYHEYQYTGMDGQLHNYFVGGGGIWAVLVENFEVRDCEITDNDNGFFVLSKNNDEAETSRNVILEKCYIHNNGNIGSDQEHNIYTQVANITFQYNRIGAMRPGSGGISLKDRSANTVIRYNWIISGARTIDLVEPEDSYGILMGEPGFHDTWVYGNIIINSYSTTSPHAANMFHYGGDIEDTTIYRKGTLHFFNNTVYIQMTKEEEWNISLFDLSTNDETVELHNNIFYRQGDANLYIGRNSGNHIFAGNNWINTGWENSRPNDEWHTFTGTVQLNTAPIEGTSPGLTNPANQDFSVQAGAAVYNQGSSLPASYASHPVNRQYKLHLDGENRSIKGGAAEIGAFEEGGGILQ